MTTEFKIEGSIAKLSLNPGDLLVIKVDGVITDEVAQRLRRHFEDLAPEGVKFVVIDRQVSLSVLEWI